MNEIKVLGYYIKEVGPDDASALLERNYEENRKVRQSYVRQLADMMERGQYIGQNGETVVVHEDGTLMDGQHRLWAVVVSGVPTVFVFMVVSGEKDVIYRSLDNGAKRTAGDLIGGSNRNLKAGIARLAYAIDEGNAPLASAIQGKLGDRGEATRVDIVEYARDNDELEETTKQAQRIRHAVGCGAGTAFGTFLHIVKRFGDDSCLDVFIEEICSQAPSDKTALALQNVIRKNHLGEKKPTSKYLIGVCLCAYDHFLAGDGTTMLNKWSSAFDRYGRVVKKARTAADAC